MSAYYNEIDPFCCEVLKARIADGRLPQGQVDGRDVREVRPEEIPQGQVHLFAGIGGFAAAARLAGLPDDFDIWTAGFPCQDISTAGKAAGLHGSRSGLFFEITRLLHGVKQRPTWVLLENTPALRTRGADRVLAEMEAVGYAVWPLVVGAYITGSPFVGKRAWLMASTSSAGLSTGRKISRRAKSVLAVPSGGGLHCRIVAGSKEHQHAWEKPRLVERPLGSAVDGIPARLVRLATRNALKAYGNSIVPACAAEILKCILATGNENLQPKI